MKIYVISMMVFLLSLSVAIINAIDVMNYEQPYQSDWIGYISSEGYQGQEYTTANLDPESQDTDLISDFRIAFGIFTKSIFYSTVGLPWMLNNFGVPGVIAVLFSLPIWLIYFIGIAQIMLRDQWEGKR